MEVGWRWGGVGVEGMPQISQPVCRIWGLRYLDLGKSSKSHESSQFSNHQVQHTCSKPCVHARALLPLAFRPCTDRVPSQSLWRRGL